MSPSDTEKNVIEKTLIETSAGKIDGQKSQIVNDVAKAITRIPFTSLPQIQVKSAPSSTQLAGGLGGAIGSDLRRAHNQLIFVEFGGKLSSLNLFKPAVVISSGITVLVRARQWADKRGWQLELRNPSPQVLRVMQLTRVLDVLGISSA